MCRNATVGSPIRPIRWAFWLLAITLAAPLAAQPAADWRQIGNTSLELALPSVASGPVRNAWFRPDGAGLTVETYAGILYKTVDFETWLRARPADPLPPSTPNTPPATLPETSARWQQDPLQTGRYFAVGRFAYRSDDGGANWTNLTSYRGQSILGDGLAGLALSPRDPDDVVVFGRHGIWRSLDAGATWSGLNQNLPNLPSRRLLALPGGTRGARLSIDIDGFPAEFEWLPGEKHAWRPVASEASLSLREQRLKLALGSRLQTQVTAVAVSGDWIYAGAANGKIWVSRDSGNTWLDSASSGQNLPKVEGFWIDSREPRIALAVLGAGEGEARYPHVARTLNGGLLWDNITNDLPETAVHAVAADRSSGAIYIATDRGAFYMPGDLNSLSTTGNWTAVSQNLPPAPAVDVRLDDAGNQLFVVLDGVGVFAASAPHRARQVRVVNAADFSTRAAAPGGLLSVLGAKLESARAGEIPAPILAATAAETQIQVPFEAGGTTLTLNLQAASGVVTLGVPLENVSPAIFIDRDGSPMLLDADSGLMLSAMTPARSGSRIQVLATGLGKVQPSWPTGMPAPLENAPQVTAPVRVYVDREPVEVTRATLAPGYIGFYLVEITLPRIVNDGPAELFLQADGHESNRVQLYLTR